MPDFSAILDKPVDEIEKPKPFPAGSYIVRITKHEFDESSQKKTPYVEFTGRVISTCGDVDEDELQEFGNWSEKELKTRFYLSEKAQFMLREFLEQHVGIECSGRTLGECIPEANNSEVGFVVTHRLGGKSGNDTIAEVDGTFNPSEAE